MFLHGGNGRLQGLVDGSGTQAASQHQDRALLGVEVEIIYSLFAAYAVGQQILANRIAGQYNLLLGEEALHSFVSYTDGTSLLG